MEIDKKKFRILFPNLAREVEEEKPLKIDSVRSEIEMGGSSATTDFREYNPDIIDFLRRCGKEEEAIEIIQYLRKRGEITEAYSEKLLNQLFDKGLESFGPRKEDGYYFRKLRTEK